MSDVAPRAKLGRIDYRPTWSAKCQTEEITEPPGPGDDWTPCPFEVVASTSSDQTLAHVQRHIERTGHAVNIYKTVTRRYQP